mmetsp:Transcript_41377/g.93222  ORF Transcript_41377/g.93222 Transcript_41377/m.93222 type:complete len:101 (+) Transcript_41377:609-911(+)
MEELQEQLVEELEDKLHAATSATAAAAEAEAEAEAARQHQLDLANTKRWGHLKPDEAAAMVWDCLRNYAKRHGAQGSASLFRELDKDGSGQLDAHEFTLG